MYGCKAGRGEEQSSAFIAKLYTALHQHGYNNFSIVANLDILNFPVCPDELQDHSRYIVCHSPNKIVQYGHFLTYSLKTLTGLKNTQVYIEIFSYKAGTSPLHFKAIQTLQDKAKRIMAPLEQKISFDFNGAYATLTKMHTEFKKLDSAIHHLLQEIETKKGAAPYTEYKKELDELHEKAKKVCLDNKRSFDFKQRLQELKQIRETAYDYIHTKIELQKLRAQLKLSLSKLDFFKRQGIHRLLKIISEAENGLIPPKEALKQIHNMQTPTEELKKRKTL